MEITNSIQWVLTHIHKYDIFLAILGLFLFLCIHERLTNKGPMLWPVVGMIPSFALHFHDIHEWNAKSLERSGGSYRMRGLFGGFAGVMVADPIKLEYILKTNFKNFPKGTYYRERFRELLGNGIFNSDDDEWREQRRIATSEMHTTRFVHYSLGSIQSLVHDKLLKVIEEQVKTARDQPMDLQDLLLRFTFDNICVAAFGVDPGCLAPGLPDIPFARAFEEATEYSLFRFLVPPFVWKTMRALSLGKEGRLKAAVKTVHEFAEATVKNRKADILTTTRSNNNGEKNNGDDHPCCDLLSRLIMRAQGRALSDDFFRDFCISFILAGRDTSSVALVWFFWLLHEHPRVEARILEELNSRQLVSNGRKDRDNNAFEAEELEKMVYLHAALTESLRLYPSVPIDFKQAREDDVLPGGVAVRRGERVLYHVYALGRLESVWGADGSEFRPERWLRGGEFVGESQFRYAVFNGGPRLCVGKKFAYVQMKMVAASTILRYRVRVVEGHVVAPKVTTTLYMKHGLRVTFEPRQSSV